MNPNIKVINKNLWVVNFDLVKSGYIKEITLNNLKPNDFIAILGNGKTVLNQADETAMKYTLPIFKVIMGYPDSLLGTDKGFLIYMRAIDPTLDKYDYQRIVQALKNLGIYDVKRNGFDTACKWEAKRRKIEKEYKRKYWFPLMLKNLKERMVKKYGND